MEKVSLEAIKIISEAEQYAQNIRLDTQAQVKKIKADSERGGRETLEQALNNALLENKRLIEEAEKKAEQQTKRIMEQSDEECKALKEHAAGKLDEAARFIIERIVAT